MEKINPFNVIRHKHKCICPRGNFIYKNNCTGFDIWFNDTTKFIHVLELNIYIDYYDDDKREVLSYEEYYKVSTEE